jgi:hypothetical protein
MLDFNALDVLLKKSYFGYYHFIVDKDFYEALIFLYIYSKEFNPDKSKLKITSFSFNLKKC